MKTTRGKVRILLLMVLIVTIALPGMDGYALTKKQRALKAYAAFLNKNKTTSTYWGTEYNRFHLAYIDGDSIPELVFSHADDDYHAMGAAVYTYASGKVKKIGTFGTYATFWYAPKKSRIRTIDSNMGGDIYLFYKIVKQKGKKTARYEFHDKERDIDISKSTYKINGKYVSRKTFYKRLKAEKKRFKYRKAGYDKCFKTTTANINKLVSNYSSLVK